jgi:phage terminase Nu1 subunit (DNA packaging protein)
MMDGRLNRRTVYRILERLRREDEERWREEAERVRLALEREEAERIRRARMRGAKRFTSVAQFPANLRKVRAS